MINIIYVQVMVQIKMRPTVTDGANHLLNEIMQLDEVGLTRGERQKVEHHIELNAYFAHPENWLLALLGE